MELDILSNLIITKVHAVTTLHTMEHTKAKKNDRPYWAIIMKYEGETVYTSGGKRYLSDLHHPLILPRGCSYEWQCTKSGHCSIVEFESEQTCAEPLTFSVKNGEKIFKLIKELEYQRNLKRPMVEIESLRNAYAILLALAQSAQKKYLPSEKQRKIALAVEYISQNYNRSLTNDELAALTGLSTVYFRKLFTHVTGVSPIAYARELRIEKAKEMLMSDYGSLTEIAQSLGYCGLYDFSRDFKKHTGVSPSQYAATLSIKS